MTIVATISSATFFWTGVETLFACGFTAVSVDDLRVRFVDADELISTLTRGVHYDAVLDAEGLPQLTPTVLMPAAPGTVVVDRNSAFTQDVEFEELRALSAQTNERLHDAHVRRLQELRRDIDALAAGAAPPTNAVDVWRLRVALAAADKFFDVNEAIAVTPGAAAFEKWNGGGVRTLPGDSLHAAIVGAIGAPAAASAYNAALLVPD